MAKRIRSHSFRGKRYKIIDVPSRKKNEFDGYCDPPQNLDKTLAINEKLTDLRHLETVIHESIHACVFDLTEQAVSTSAHDIASLLWRLGYRKMK